MDDLIRRARENDPSLKRLELFKCGLDDIEFMRENTHIEELLASFNNITSLEPLRNNTTVRVLVLMHNPIVSLEPLRGNATITYLNLNYTSIETIEHLRDCTALDTLAIAWTQITSLEPLKKSTSLTYLCFEQCPTTREDGDFMRRLTINNHISLMSLRRLTLLVLRE
jgi:Leucine-rich repeat (LRR) protein